MAPTTAPPREAPRAPWIVWAGLAVVLSAAAVLSFDELRNLALAVSISERLAWLLPIAVDAGAAVSCATWLSDRTPVYAARFAGRMTWSLLAVTVVGNAGQLGMTANHITPPWWVAVLVGAIAPAVVGSVVHLVVLLTRQSGPAQTAGSTGDQPETIEIRDMHEVLDDETGGDPLVPAVREWVQRHDGTPSQRQVRTEFGVGAERARRLMQEVAA